MTVPWLFKVFALIGVAIGLGIVALALVALPDPRGWRRRLKARNERPVREPETRRGHS